MKYQTVKMRHYKDYTANSLVSEVISLNTTKTHNLNLVELLLYVSC